MTRYADHDMTEEDLRHLEDEGADTEHRDSRPQQSLPEPLYRLEVGHSHETFLAVFEGILPQTIALPPSAASDPADEVPADALGEEADSPDPAPEGPAVLSTGTYVLANTRYGRDLCRVMGTVRNPGYIAPEEIVHIERVATDSDMERLEQNLVKERQAFSVCQERIAARNLPMKLVSAHYLVEEPKVLFFFTADSRVDFRELVKDLVSVFKMRIELRQIGVRDEARVTGGCGVCGRILCCHGVTDKLVPVSIKMAKDQNLSLNSMKISGPCGRLLCCLAYEFGFYREARRSIPPEGSRFTWEGVLFRVTEINVPAGRVRISGEDGRVLVVDASQFTQSEGRWVLKAE